MTPEERAELRALEQAATPGPWRTWNDGHIGTRGGHVGGIFMPTVGSDRDHRQPDAKFVAAMRNAIVALLDAADRADAETARAEAAEARVARVRVLANEHEATLAGRLMINDWPATTTERALVEGFASQIRAALADPAEGGEGA